MIKELLENDLPAYYKVGRRRSCYEIVSSKTEFDLVDRDNDYVVDYKSGSASFSNNASRLSVINYEAYIGKYVGTHIADGKRRCDFIITDKNADNLIVLCEITSTLDRLDNLSLPITETLKDGSLKVIFPHGKYQKAEQQLYESLVNIMRVPSIMAYIAKKQKKICLMSYLIRPTKNKTVITFNRNRIVEAEDQFPTD